MPNFFIKSKLSGERDVFRTSTRVQPFTKFTNKRWLFGIFRLSDKVSFSPEWVGRELQHNLAAGK